MREYTGDGVEVNQANASGTGADTLNYPLIIGIALAVIVVIALVVYFAVIRPRQKELDAAAEAAAAKLESLQNRKR